MVKDDQAGRGETRRRPRRRAAVVALGLVAAVVAAGVVVAVSPRGNAWESRVAVCPFPEVPDRLSGLGCLGSAWVDAYRAGDLEGFYAALETGIAVRPELLMDCHNAGHAAGKHLLLDADDVGVIRDAMEVQDPCATGMLHGATDAFGAIPRSLQEVAVVADVCMLSLAALGDSCAEGLGHAAWVSTGADPAESARWCLLLDDESSLRWCAGGVAMQSLKIPVGGGKADVVPGEAKVVIPAMCEQMIDAGLPVGDAGLCFAETATGFVLDVVQQTMDWSRSLDGKETRNVPLPWPAIRELWSGAIGGCRALPDHSQECLERMADSVYATTLEQPEATGRVCSLMEDVALVARCVSYVEGAADAAVSARVVA